MSLIRGLKDIDAQISARRGPEGTGVRWLKLDDGQSAKIRFVNETDSDSPDYDPTRGLTLIVEEHTNPQDFRRKAVCSMEDEGRCYGCEQYRRDPKAGWKARMRFYTNLLIDNGVDEPFVGVWSMGVLKSTTFNTIREYAEEAGSLSNMVWKVKRSGKGTETTYILIPGAVDKEPFDWSKIEIPSLDAAVRQVPYPEQEGFYMAVENLATSTDTDW